MLNYFELERSLQDRRERSNRSQLEMTQNVLSIKKGTGIFPKVYTYLEKLKSGSSKTTTPCCQCSC